MVTKTFRGVYANVKRRLCRSNSTSVTCQNIPGPPPAFPIVWEVGPGNEAMIWQGCRQGLRKGGARHARNNFTGSYTH